jgi:uncharacterized protein YeeX (DUF496 family)
VDLVNVLKEVINLTTSVGELKADVDRLYQKVETHSERIVRLENREEFLAQKMANEAIKSVFQINERLFSRLSVLERKVGIEPAEGAALLPGA